MRERALQKQQTVVSGPYTVLTQSARTLECGFHHPHHDIVPCYMDVSFPVQRGRRSTYLDSCRIPHTLSTWLGHEDTNDARKPWSVHIRSCQNREVSRGGRMA